MFDPSTGRWFEEDPKGFAAHDPNLYRYGKNSPTNATDPSGLFPPNATDQFQWGYSLAPVAKGETENPSGLNDRRIGYRFDMDIHVPVARKPKGATQTWQLQIIKAFHIAGDISSAKVDVGPETNPEASIILDVVDLNALDSSNSWRDTRRLDFAGGGAPPANTWLYVEVTTAINGFNPANVVLPTQGGSATLRGKKALEVLNKGKMQGPTDTRTEIYVYINYTNARAAHASALAFFIRSYFPGELGDALFNQSILMRDRDCKMSFEYLNTPVGIFSSQVKK
jgi:hypothetical protein